MFAVSNKFMTVKDIPFIVLSESLIPVFPLVPYLMVLVRCSPLNRGEQFQYLIYATFFCVAMLSSKSL